ncbi:UNVERIFIED_CONTAM: hypothetical protein Sangu_1671900 [Sesamum angustifolium]|uniref:Uncharacterized protein n=1 Tax=Sesamum angustifolium TaxID=2727405 RepID=A0AAW2MIA0_9LAMI
MKPCNPPAFFVSSELVLRNTTTTGNYGIPTTPALPRWLLRGGGGSPRDGWP